MSSWKWWGFLLVCKLNLLKIKRDIHVHMYICTHNIFIFSTLWGTEGFLIQDVHEEKVKNCYSFLNVFNYTFIHVKSFYGTSHLYLYILLFPCRNKTSFKGKLNSCLVILVKEKQIEKGIKKFEEWYSI